MWSVGTWRGAGADFYDKSNYTDTQVHKNKNRLVLIAQTGGWFEYKWSQVECVDLFEGQSLSTCWTSVQFRDCSPDTRTAEDVATLGGDHVAASSLKYIGSVHADWAPDKVLCGSVWVCFSRCVPLDGEEMHVYREGGRGEAVDLNDIPQNGNVVHVYALASIQLSDARNNYAIFRDD